MEFLLGMLFIVALFIFIGKEGKSRQEYFKNKAANPRPWYHFHDYNKDTKKHR